MAERDDNQMNELARLGLSKEQQDQVLNEATDPSIPPTQFSQTIQKLKQLKSLSE